MAGSTYCQFCGRTLSAGGQAVVNAPRAMAGINIISGAGAKKVDYDSWQDKAYRVCSVLLALYGAFEFAAGLNLIHTFPSASLVYHQVVGSFYMIAGILLFMEVGWVQWFMKWVLILSLIGGLFDFLLLALVFSLSPALGVIFTLIKVAVMGAQGLLLYLLYQVGDV